MELDDIAEAALRSTYAELTHAWKMVLAAGIGVMVLTPLPARPHSVGYRVSIRPVFPVSEAWGDEDEDDGDDDGPDDPEPPDEEFWNALQRPDGIAL